ncbi:MAG TPA: YafY family protein [Burkholderiaceae bacterium]|nr:YafY family protein [Burkholderiaceae bacterium]
MRASRLLSILMLLQTRGRMSAQALAAELETSVRTVFRDLDQLSAAGVPVWADRGRNGGFQLQDGWRTRLTGLTSDEARAIFMTGLPGPAEELGLGEAMASAQLKLLAALPADWQGDAQRVGSRFHLDPIDWFRNAEPPEYLRTVAEAVWSERRLKIRYQSWNRVSDRVVDPLGLVLKAGMWYMVARAEREQRTFRLSSIQALEPLAERFSRPRNFDLGKYWTASTKRFEAGVYRSEAQLRVTALGLRRLQSLSAIVAAAATRTATPPDADGWMSVTIPIESAADAARELLRLGPEGEVLQPPELRALMKETAARLAGMYLREESTFAPRSKSGRRG